jgi:MSHA type pilus biogenesis protein MshL
MAYSNAGPEKTTMRPSLTPIPEALWRHPYGHTYTRLANCFRRPFVFLTVAALLSSCAYQPSVPPSQGHISRQPGTSPDKDKILPVVTSPAYVPPPKPKPKVPTYSVVVHEVPVKELLLALARDTKENIDIHPGLQGLVSLNAIDEPLTSILDRIAKQVNMRYRVEGRTIMVSPDTPYMKTYQVNYVNMSRDTTSSVSVSGQISGGVGGTTTSGSAQGGAAGAGTGQGGTSTTSVHSTSKNNFWESIKENIQNILKATNRLSQATEDKQARAEAQRNAREERLAQAEAVARAGANATSLFNTVFGPDGQTREPTDVAINYVTGTIIVLATDKQHALIQEFLNGVTNASQRQVLIEATIVEVQLSNNYQAGVDWSRITRAAGDGFSFKQQLLSGNLGTPPVTSIAYANNPNAPTVSATIKLLEQFGNTKVLSSPKLMALNNQTALLKVVDNVVYFTIEQQITDTANVGSRQTFTTTVNTVAVGVSMSMTPQINDNGVITLSVRPTISRILDFKSDPNPALAFAQDGTPLKNPIANQIPEISVREMESVLQLASGQTAILGGLMQDNIKRNRDAVPGLGRIPTVGDAFSYRDEAVSKSELIIFLRPTVVTNPSLDSDELKFFRRFVPEVERTGSRP